MAQNGRHAFTASFRRLVQLQAPRVEPWSFRGVNFLAAEHGHPAYCELCGRLNHTFCGTFNKEASLPPHSSCAFGGNHSHGDTPWLRRGLQGAWTDTRPGVKAGNYCQENSSSSNHPGVGKPLILVSSPTSAAEGIQITNYGIHNQPCVSQSSFFPPPRHLSSMASGTFAEDQSKATGAPGQPIGPRRRGLPDGPSLADFILSGSQLKGVDAELADSDWAGCQTAGGQLLGSQRDSSPTQLADGVPGLLSHGPLTGDLDPVQTAALNPVPQMDPPMTEAGHQGSESAGVWVENGRVYFETYGCQMNVNDLEIVLSILAKAGYRQRVDKPEDSDVILINTCAIRENAETKIWHRLNYFKHIKQRWSRRRGGVLPPAQEGSPPKVAVLGCMAERLKTKLLDADKMVDVVCGPDAYRDLPRLLSQVDAGQAGVNTLLSLEETYADVSPVRVAQNSASAFVSIMRGCDNMCAYCIVPFTRGRERSRPPSSILREVGELWEHGVKEVMLLGQNVNSYRDTSPPAGTAGLALRADGADGAGGARRADPTGSAAPAGSAEPRQHRETAARAAGGPDGEAREEAAEASPAGGQTAAVGPTLAGSPHESAAASVAAREMSRGFSTMYRPKSGGLRFAHLLDQLAEAFPEMRFRFTSPHPKDFPDELLFVMRDRPNVCRSIHLPAQSGSTSVLERMRRGYSREAYLALVCRIREILPHVALTSDFITGFCGETEEEHRDTLRLIEEVGYDMAYMFAYSMREKTHAHRRYADDVPEDVKKRRLAEMIEVFRRSTVQRYECQMGQVQLVLVEGPNKRAPEAELLGRNDGGHRVMFPKLPVRDLTGGGVKAANRRKEHTEGLDDVATSDIENVVPGPGDYLAVRIVGTTAASLRGQAVYRTTLTDFYQRHSTDVVAAAVA